MTTPQPDKPGPITWVAANRIGAGIGLMVAGAGVAVLPTLLATWYEYEFLGTNLLTGMVALLLLGTGVVLRFMPAEVADADRVRMVLLTLGGVGGLLVAAVGVALCYHWWDLLDDWLRRGAREGAGKILLSLAVMLVGLAIMLVSLQLGRADERTSAGLRRLLYGYNVVLTAILLALILGVANVLVGVKWSGVIDATSSREFSVSDRTLNLVGSLDRPLHIYVIGDFNDSIMVPLRVLMRRLEDRSRKVQVTYLSDRKQIDELMSEFPGKLDAVTPRAAEPGVLVVLGDRKPENAVFLRMTDLVERDFQDNTRRLKAEDAIATAVLNLQGGASGKTIVYFTQGMGEPNLNDPQSPEGLGAVRAALASRGGFDVRALTFNPAEPAIPADAGIVVVANPKPPVPPQFADALRKYLADGRGKAVVFAAMPRNLWSGTRSASRATGLEELLGEFNVDVTTSCVLAEDRAVVPQEGREITVRVPVTRVVVESAEAALQAQNPIATSFSSTNMFMYNPRLVRPAQAMRNPRFRVEPLLATWRNIPVWAENETNRVAIIQRINGPEWKQLVAQQPLPVAVTATEAGPPEMPGHPPTSSKPKLAVFGDISFLFNATAGDESGTDNFSLLANTLDWLAERPTSIGLPKPAVAVYRLDPTANLGRLLILPGFLMVVSVLGLGLGVWVVRRR